MAPPPTEGGRREVEAPREIAPPREITVQEWVRLVAANQQLSFTRGERPVVTEFDPEEDAQLDWVQWNRARDEEFEGTEPPPLTGEENTLPDRLVVSKSRRKR
jgi:hypothetical protein